MQWISVLVAPLSAPTWSSAGTRGCKGPTSQTESDPRRAGSRFRSHDNPIAKRDRGFQAAGPALQILQLNVEGLLAAKRGVISSIAERQNRKLTLSVSRRCMSRMTRPASSTSKALTLCPVPCTPNMPGNLCPQQRDRGSTRSVHPALRCCTSW